MKLVLFEPEDGVAAKPGLLSERGIVDISAAVGEGHTPQLTMQGIIDQFDELRPELEELAANAPALAEDSVRLRPPLPRPGKILACIANYWEHAQREPRPLNMFLKSSDAVVGPGDTIELPRFAEPWIFMHEAELALVMKGPAKMVKAADWKSAVFGYTSMIDVSARGEGRRTWKTGSWLGKSFDTFAPIGPCIVTADEIDDPQKLSINLWVNEDLKQSFNTDDMAHQIPRIIEWVSSIHELEPGDVIATGTNHRGLSAFQDSDKVELEVQGLGTLHFNLRDDLKRTWPRTTRLEKAEQGKEGTAPQATGKYS